MDTQSQPDPTSARRFGQCLARHFCEYVRAYGATRPESLDMHCVIQSKDILDIKTMGPDGKLLTLSMVSLFANSEGCHCSILIPSGSDKRIFVVVPDVSGLAEVAEKVFSAIVALHELMLLQSDHEPPVYRVQAPVMVRCWVIQISLPAGSPSYCGWSTGEDGYPCLDKQAIAYSTVEDATRFPNKLDAQAWFFQAQCGSHPIRSEFLVSVIEVVVPA